MNTPGSLNWVAPRTRNSMARRVLPQPAAAADQGGPAQGQSAAGNLIQSCDPGGCFCQFFAVTRLGLRVMSHNFRPYLRLSRNRVNGQNVLKHGAIFTHPSETKPGEQMNRLSRKGPRMHRKRDFGTRVR